MNQRKLLIGSNWKMNKTGAEAVEYTRQLLGAMESLRGIERLQIFLIPPYTAIAAVKRECGGKIWVGAQNMHWAESGAYTGEISAPMLKELEVDLVELGHAERRQYWGETDAAINQKVHTALRYGLRPLVCVGEQLDDRDNGVEREAVAKQLRTVLDGVPLEEVSNLILAYEPVWAIGQGGAMAPPPYVYAMCSHIRDVVSEVFGAGLGVRVPVIYGGDVRVSTAADILHHAGVDGLFVGRAAWQADSFAALIRSCLENTRES